MARGRKRSRSVSGSGSGSGAAERPSKTTRRGSSNSGDGADGGDGTPLSPGQGSDAAAVKKFYSDVARAILRFSTGMAEDFPDADKETLLDAVKAVLTDGIRDGLLDHEAGASAAIGSPLYLAAKLNLPDVAEFLLSVGASMVAPSMGTTPLDIACSEGNKEVLAELSSRLSELQNEYRSVHTPTKYGTSRVDPSWRSPGVYVSPSPNTRKLEVLEGLDQDRWDENNMALGFRALAGCVATYEGGENTQRLSDLETLLARGADPNFTSEEVRNVKPPLHVAASLDVFDIADTLLEAGAHLAASWKGSNAYAVAVAEGNSRVLSVFRAHVAAWEQSFGH